MPETIPPVGLLIVRSRADTPWCEATLGSGHLTLTDRSVVSIQKRLPSPSLSRISESHAVGEGYEVFICFNRHNPILKTVI